MPMVRGLKERAEKFSAKMVPEQTGARYGAVKSIAVGRFIAGASATREPAGQYGMYFAFIQKVRSAAFSHGGDTLKKIIEGLKQDFTVSKGADPAILDKLAKLVVGG